MPSKTSYRRKDKGKDGSDRKRGRRSRKLLDDLKIRRGYSHLKEEALDRTMWRHRFGGGIGSVVRQIIEWMNEWMNRIYPLLGNITAEYNNTLLQKHNFCNLFPVTKSLCPRKRGIVPRPLNSVLYNNYR